MLVHETSNNVFLAALEYNQYCGMLIECGIIVIVLLYLNKLHEVSGKMHVIHLDHIFFFLDEEESEEDDDDDDDEDESTEESTKVAVDNKQKQKNTEETPKTAVRNVQTLIVCHLTEHWKFWFCYVMYSCIKKKGK